MDKKISEVTIDGANWKIRPNCMTRIQLPCSTKKEATKLFNQLKKNLPENYKAGMIMYNVSNSSITDEINSDCSYYMIVSKIDFLVLAG